MRMIDARSLTALLLVLGASAAGCATDGGGDDASGATLTVVGERALQLENGWTTELTVRYADASGAPLQGDVAFTLDGTVAGAFLSDTHALAGADGLATLTLTTGSTGTTSFAVEAEAAGAAPATWDVAVLEKALDVAGTYRLDSHFDLASGLPGAVGTVVNTFIEMTDDPYDPATFVLDKIEESSSSTIRNLIHAARPTLDAVLNEVLLAATPDLVDRLIAVGDDFGQIAREFGTTSELRVTADRDIDTGMVAEHVLTGLRFTIDGTDYPYAFVDLDLAEPTASAPFDYDATHFTIGGHQLPMAYGAILMVALDQLVIPLVDANAHDLRSLLADYIDCADVGEAIADYLGFGSGGLYEGVCELGLDATAGFVEDQIRGLDATAMQLAIAGEARWIDSNHDRRVDVLQGGAWEGEMSYAGAPAPLGDSPFHGERAP